MNNGFSIGYNFEGTYKKVGERDMLDELMDLAITQGYDKETTRVQYERKEGKKIYSIIVEDN